MAETSGFFQSVNGDRKYGAAFLAAREAALASNGVHNDELSVTQGGGMTINVAAGRAFINGYFYQNDGAKSLNISAADATLSRIDAVMLQLNLNAREIFAMVSKGTPSASPVAPAPIRSGGTYELKLAEIRVAPGTTEITLDMITDTRLNSEVCGIVSGTIGKLDTAEFYKTMQASFDKFMADLEGALSEDAAGNLLTQINDLKDDVNVTLTHAKSGTVHSLTGLSGRTGIISAVFKATAAYAEGNTFTVDGVTYTAKTQTGEALPDGAFASGTVVGVLIDTVGKTINFKAAGKTGSEYTIQSGSKTVTEDDVEEGTYTKFTVTATGSTIDMASAWITNKGDTVPRLRVALIIDGAVVEDGIGDYHTNSVSVSGNKISFSIADDEVLDYSDYTVHWKIVSH